MQNLNNQSSQTVTPNALNNQQTDRLKYFYPNVNEDDTPLPRSWSTQDKCSSIGLTQNNLRVHYKGYIFFYINIYILLY